MSNIVGRKAPTFKLEGVLNKKFTNYEVPTVNGKWSVLLFYPLNFTFVCPTEIISFSDNVDKFTELGANVYGISVDSKYSHLAWTDMSRQAGGIGDIRFPLLSDINKEVARQYEVLNSSGLALRGLFIIDKDGVVQHATINNGGVGRSVDETLRLLQAYQHNQKSGELCPVGWKQGAGTIKNEPTGYKDYAAQNYSA